MRDLPPLLLLRHGETAWNREARMQGGLDSPLTVRGRAQAVAMGRLLAALDVGARTHAARTSPLGRAAETARLALAPLGLAASPEPRLAEIGMGEWTGLTRAEIGLRWPGPADEPLFAFYARCPGGEGLAGLADRAAGVLASLDRPTVLVTHGITLRVLCALGLGLPPEEGARFEMRQGSVVHLDRGRMDRFDPGWAGPAADLPGGRLPG